MSGPAGSAAFGRPSPSPPGRSGAPGVGSASRAAVTVSHVLGEISWLISQSARHADIRVHDLAWLAMPAIVERQFHLFRDGDRPVGVALWAHPPADAEARLASAPLSAANRLGPEEWTGGANLWLVDLVAPFATAANRQLELMLGDLMTGPFKGREFRMLRLDPATGEGSPAVVDPGAGERLVAEMAALLRPGPDR